MRCNRATSKLILSYLHSLNTPRALAVWLMFKFNEHDALAALDINPDNYLDPRAFRLDYLATMFLSKAEFLSTSVDKHSKALSDFMVVEGLCKEVNLDNLSNKCRQNTCFEWVHNATIRKIEGILVGFNGDEIFDSANWGPGVSLHEKVKRDTSPTNKFRFENGITRDLYDFMGDLLAIAYPTWKIEKFDLQVGNKVVTVPKNSKTDRTIAIEPGLNLWFQKAFGTMIRRRLQRVGVDLSSQERNQQLAHSSSINGELATVDFSQASDSISRSTVRHLLPYYWHFVMDLLRSKFGFVEGTLIEYEKFSSMGNGFTFELESLIFYAIAVSVCSYLQLDHKKVSVYGDDVILPIKAFNLFSEICEIYGFRVNKKKSFSSGSFRESCGSHFFKGLDCKPYFLRKVIKGDLDIYLAANTIRRISRSRLNHSSYCDSRFFECWRQLKSMVSRPCLISEGYGDGGFISNFDEATPTRARHGIEGYHCFAIVSRPLGYFSDDHALLLARLKGRSVDIGLGNETFIRNRVRLFRKKLLIRQWADLGPWY